MKASRLWDQFLVELRPGDTVVHLGQTQVEDIHLTDQRVGPLGRVLAFSQSLNHSMLSQPVDVLAISEASLDALQGASILLKDPHRRPRRIFIETHEDHLAECEVWLELRGYLVTSDDDGLCATVKGLA